MQCPYHPNEEVIGYCFVCGELGCEQCLTSHEGQLYCQTHYASVAEKEGRSARSRKRQLRQRLVVHYKDGRLDYGVCFALNPHQAHFYLERMTPEGEPTGDTVPVRFPDLKAVFYVKSFDGNFDRHARYEDWRAEGNEVVVEFEDGECIHGHTLHRYDEEEPRFYLIPHSPKTNNLSILVEKSAVNQVYSREEYKRKREEDKAREKLQSADSSLTQEETLGDFYFETRSYEAALQQYQYAQKKVGQSHRLRKKILAAEYNIGVQYIKRREYAQALKWMERVQEQEPKNHHAKKKILQLRKILDKMSASG